VASAVPSGLSQLHLLLLQLAVVQPGFSENDVCGLFEISADEAGALLAVLTEHGLLETIPLPGSPRFHITTQGRSQVGDYVGVPFRSKAEGREGPR
jgi:hypothetical protein